MDEDMFTLYECDKYLLTQPMYAYVYHARALDKMKTFDQQKDTHVKNKKN